MNPFKPFFEESLERVNHLRQATCNDVVGKPQEDHKASQEQSAISRQQKPVSDTAWRFQCHCVGNHKGYPYEFVGEWKMSWSGAVHIRALLGMSSPQVAMGIRIEIRSHGFGIVCRS